MHKIIAIMKHYCAKPSVQLSKHIKSLQDDIKHAVMSNTSLNWSNHKNVHCMRLRNAQTLNTHNLPAGQSCTDVMS